VKENTRLHFLLLLRFIDQKNNMFTPKIKRQKTKTCTAQINNTACGKPLTKRSMTDRCGGCLHLMEIQLKKDQAKTTAK
jgi:hypothetical protein